MLLQPQALCRDEATKINILNQTIFTINKSLKSTSKEKLWSVFRFLCKFNYNIVSSLKTHGSVLCSPRKWSAHKQREYTDRNNKVTILKPWYIAP